ncbi:MAG: peptide chain release factor N(5)-glutamine methyltransferase [Sulfuriferula multivorans]|uniref:Release factor glutamine methyltransferase n=1 Tax=Sulfuriferula multivorans TaxID=1559896 RepID=A0A7C9NSZ2_9PROT|nr:peptide chain release factor N(5)-glutamine methyltransferase [Sulfuriferula multivorans]
MNVSQLLSDATQRIAAAIDLPLREARLEARVLASHAWQVDAAWLIAHDTDSVLAVHAAQFQTLLSRRLQGTPIAYLVGLREFFGRSFEVSADVLIPRPDTELLVERALATLPPDQPVEVLDMGTGSGCIAITLALECPRARVTAVDCSPAALTMAQRNAVRLSAPIEYVVSNWFAALGVLRFDLIVSNPPYIANQDPHLARGDVRFEPLTALASGPDGLDDLRHLIHAARDHLKPGAGLLLEHGYDQSDAVLDLLRKNGIAQAQSWADLSGTLRVSGGKLSE